MTGTTEFDRARYAKGIDVDAVRDSLADVVDRAGDGLTTVINGADGMPVAAVVPIDVASARLPRYGIAIYDGNTQTITVIPHRLSRGEPSATVVSVDRAMPDHYAINALVRAGWNPVLPDDTARLRSGVAVNVVHVPQPPRQGEQFARWIEQYGDRPATARCGPGRIRYLVEPAGGAVLEGDAIVLETADRNGSLFQRATWPGVGRTLADLITGAPDVPATGAGMPPDGMSAAGFDAAAG